MHYLVTGGAGFIGSHLCAALIAAGHGVTLLDDLSTGRRENVPAGARLIVGDVADEAIVREAAQNADGIFHLAAIASVERCEKEPERSHAVNHLGTAHALATAGTLNIPLVYASSSAVYGDASTPPLTEAARTEPLSAYGRDKLAGETEARLAAKSGVASIGLRFFNVYGPRQDPASPYSGVISIFARRLLAKEPLRINGDGLQTRDFIYVADVVAALSTSMHTLHEKRLTCEVFNVCTGEEITVLALAEALAEAAKLPLSVEHGPPRAGDARHSCGDPTLARVALGFRAATPRKEGFSATLQWMKDECT